MKCLRKDSCVGGSDSPRIRAKVIATRSAGTTTEATGVLEWAETHARQTEPEKSFAACTCATCTATASTINKANARRNQRMERRPDVANMSIIDGRSRIGWIVHRLMRSASVALLLLG